LETLNPEQREALRDLERAVYGPPPRHHWRGRAAWRQLRKLPRLVTGKTVRDRKEVLPPLWRHDRAG